MVAIRDIGIYYLLNGYGWLTDQFYDRSCAGVGQGFLVAIKIYIENFLLLDWAPMQSFEKNSITIGVTSLPWRWQMGT